MRIQVQHALLDGGALPAHRWAEVSGREDRGARFQIREFGRHGQADNCGDNP